MARIDTIHDSQWQEVKFINAYAVFNGYLMMGVRGLGVLVFTWTTVVLLGGFVSVLGKDFWYLTVITLVQTAGVFNFLLEETLNDIVRSWWGLLAAVAATVIKPFRKGKERKDNSVARKVLAVVLSVTQVLVLAILLCPVAVLFVFGMYISAGVGLWRLIEHDFDTGDGGPNLKPALQILYSLAVAQGVLFGYKTMHAFGAKFGLAEFVAGLSSVNKNIVLDYLEGTVAGCEKDPSFAAGRNLVTYAVDLMMEAKSNHGFIAGVRALGAVITDFFDGDDRKELAKHLLTRAASSKHMIYRLLETLGPRSLHETEIRVHAARIVGLVAGAIQLEQFPRATQCISSLINPFEEPSLFRHDRDPLDDLLPNEYERTWLREEYELYLLDKRRKRRDSTVGKSPGTVSNNSLHHYEGLVTAGLNILVKLSVDDDNRRVICDTEGLLSMITIAPLLLCELHSNYHLAWLGTVEKSWKLTGWRVPDLGETDTETKLQREITENSKAIIGSLESILDCDECGGLHKRQAVEICLDLSLDVSSVMASASRSRIFIWILLLIFLFADDCFGETYSSTHRRKRSSDIRKLAGEKLSDMGKRFPCHDLSAILRLGNEGNASSMLQAAGHFFSHLTSALADAANVSNGVHAAQVLEYLCTHYTKDDEYLKKLKEATANVMEKVLEEIVAAIKWRREKISKFQLSAQDSDLESGGVSQGNDQGNTSSSQRQTGEQSERSKLRKALISLCWSICENWYVEGSNMKSQLDKITRKRCAELGNPDLGFRDRVYEADLLRVGGLLSRIDELNSPFVRTPARRTYT